MVDALSRLPFVDSTGLAGILGEPHSTIHRALRDLLIVAECDVDVWVDPDDDPRLFGGSIRRGSPEWRSKYMKRWSIERVFSRWKTHGRAEGPLLP